MAAGASMWEKAAHLRVARQQRAEDQTGHKMHLPRPRQRPYVLQQGLTCYCPLALSDALHQESVKGLLYWLTKIPQLHPQRLSLVS